MICCPKCSLTADIISFDSVPQSFATTPVLIIAPDVLWCPCGCIFKDGVIILDMSEINAPTSTPGARRKFLGSSSSLIENPNFDDCYKHKGRVVEVDHAYGTTVGRMIRLANGNFYVATGECHVSFSHWAVREIGTCNGTIRFKLA